MVSDEELQITFQTFKAATPTFGPYSTTAVLENNLKLMTDWGAANLPGGLGSAWNLGFFELAFTNCLARLTRDPNWKSKEEKRAALKQEWDSLTGSEARQRYETDPQFRRFVDEGA